MQTSADDFHASPRPRVPDGCRVYAIGDIHGRMDLLQRLLARIEEDAGQQAPPQRLVMVFLGDYVDRGPDSARVVERLLAGPPPTGPLTAAQWICLRGNHEDCMVRFLEDAAGGRGWIANGGFETVASYAGALPERARADMAVLQDALALALPPDHLRFLARLPLLHREGDYAFVHAGIRPGIPLAEQDPADLLWIRDEFLHAHAAGGMVVVHGHTPCPTPEIRPHRIGIDTKAWQSGVLTAVVLQGDDRRFLQT